MKFHNFNDQWHNQRWWEKSFTKNILILNVNQTRFIHRSNLFCKTTKKNNLSIYNFDLNYLHLAVSFFAYLVCLVLVKTRKKFSTVMQNYIYDETRFYTDKGFNFSWNIFPFIFHGPIRIIERIENLYAEKFKKSVFNFKLIINFFFIDEIS